MLDKLPKILESHKIGARGEAFLEFIMSKHCLMHKVVGYKDIGIDYICEWLNGGAPSRILFGIQVKTTERQDLRIKEKGINRRLNDLEYVSIKPLPFDIKPETVSYWSGLEMPLYLFCVVKNDSKQFDCYYSRLTPILHKTSGDDEKAKEIRASHFYRANIYSDFNDVVKKERMNGGFIRDLFIDSVRCCYNSGSVSYRNPKNFGLDNWRDNVLFPDVLAEEGADYLKKVKKGLLLLEKLGLIKVDPEFEYKIKKIRDDFKRKLSKT